MSNYLEEKLKQHKMNLATTAAIAGEGSPEEVWGDDAALDHYYKTRMLYWGHCKYCRKEVRHFSNEVKTKIDYGFSTSWHKRCIPWWKFWEKR